ncbi:MAG: Fe(2+)-trafficking protein [Planctomycetota bacterium]|jgi:Fe-S cluster biosynthesis and repair protein YggX
MNSLDERIAQFEKMAVEDPDNDMAHFSLGSAYLQAGRHKEAAVSLQRSIEINADLSKAYQLAGQALIESGHQDKAVPILEAGYEIAAQRGEIPPRDAIAGLLSGIGREPPQLSAQAQARAEQLQASGGFICRATGRPGTKLPDPPMRGALGQWIFEHVSAETWREWILQGTKVINELRLDFSREEDQRTYDGYMCEFLGIDQKLYEELTKN